MNQAQVVSNIPVEKIVPSKENPRSTLENLDEIARSIRSQGILQPLLLRPLGDNFEIVCGHRRFAGAKKAELTEVPAIVREMTDEQVRHARLTENLQRTDLTPVEECEGFEQMVKWGYSVAGIADKIGKGEGYVESRLALKHASAKVKEALSRGLIGMGHVEILIQSAFSDIQDRLLDEILREALSPAMAAGAAKKYGRPLSEALFDRAKVMKKLPACHTCEYNSTNSAERFKDLAAFKKDVCLYLVCFGEKSLRAIPDLEKEATAKGFAFRRIDDLLDTSLYRYRPEYMIWKTGRQAPRSLSEIKKEIVQAIGKQQAKACLEGTCESEERCFGMIVGVGQRQGEIGYTVEIGWGTVAGSHFEELTKAAQRSKWTGAGAGSSDPYREKQKEQQKLLKKLRPELWASVAGHLPGLTEKDDPGIIREFADRAGFDQWLNLGRYIGFPYEKKSEASKHAKEIVKKLESLPLRQAMFALATARIGVSGWNTPRIPADLKKWGVKRVKPAVEPESGAPKTKDEKAGKSKEPKTGKAKRPGREAASKNGKGGSKTDE